MPGPISSSPDPLAELREHFMQGADSHTPIEGRAPWFWAMDRQSPRAVEMLISMGSDLDARDKNERGFLLHAMDTHMPRWLIIHGLRKLNNTWWWPDNKGRTPFHHPLLDKVVATALCQRAWSEQLSGQRMFGKQHPVELARARGRHEVARALEQWFPHH